MFWVFQGGQELQDPPQSGLPWQHCRPLVSENRNFYVSVRFNHRGGLESIPGDKSEQGPFPGWENLEDLENLTQATCSS